jgi:hypothetical protein
MPCSHTDGENRVRHHHPATPPAETAPAPYKPWRDKKVILTVVLAAAMALTAWLAIPHGPGTFTARGSETVTIDAPDVTDGSQVTVTDSGGHVIGTGTLATDNSPAAQKAIREYDALNVELGALGGDSGPGISVYKFTVPDLPAGQARYGVSVGKDRGTLWFTQQQMHAGANLSLGD